MITKAGLATIPILAILGVAPSCTVGEDSEQPATLERAVSFSGCDNQCGTVCFQSDGCETECNVDFGEGVCNPTTCGAEVALPCDRHVAGNPSVPPQGAVGGGGGGITVLSYGRSTWQSSTDFGGTSDRAVDGNADGVFWNGSVTHTAVEDNPEWGVWLRIGKPVRIYVTNREDCCANRLNGAHVWLRRASNDHTWDRIATLSGSPGVQTINVPNVASRIVSDALAIVLDGSQRILSLAEVSAVGPTF
jgi:hypothetical protein